MKKMYSVICAAVLSLSASAVMADSALPSMSEIEAIQGGATVAAVDKAKRTFTLKAKDGKTHTFSAPAEMQNFDQMKAGDKVEASYSEEVSVTVNKSGMPANMAEKTTLARAEKGGKPGMILTNSKEITGVVTAIDYKARTVTLQGPRGNELTTTVSPDVKNFKNVTKGNNVVISVVKVLTIGVVAN